MVLKWNEDLGRYEGTLSHLPSSVDKYIFINEKDGDILMAYYLLSPKDGLFDQCKTEEEKYQRLAEVVKNGDMQELINQYANDIKLLDLTNFHRQFYTNLYVPNKVRGLNILKVDEYSQPIQGVEFTLYDDKECQNPVAKGMTDANGYVSFSAQLTGNNIITNPNGGLSSKVYYPLSQNRDENGQLTEKYLWLKETKAMIDYDINPTVIKVLVSNDNIYVDAGTKTDNVSVLKGIGKLDKTMIRYATDGAIDITLRDITSTKYKYIGNLNTDGFPDIHSQANWELDTSEEPLNLHFGLENALLDYGIHETDRQPVFQTNEGWIGIGVKQNKAHLDKDDPYYSKYAQREDLDGVNISALFTGSTMVVVKDRKITPNIGHLSISKEVTGELGDTNKEFHFTITLDNKNINYTYPDITFENGVAHITLKHNEKVTIMNLPSDIGYTVSEIEANQDGYKTTSINEQGHILKDKTIEVKFTNNKTNKPETTDDDKHTDESNPETGDQTNIPLFATMIVISIVIIVSLVIFKKKNK